MEKRRVDLAYESSDRIVGFHETFVKGNPEIETAVSKAVRANEGGGTTADLEDPQYLQTREVFAEMLQSHSEELHRIRKEVFDSPLPEPRGRLLHPLDLLARRFRYWAFALGMVSFLVASILSVLGKN